MIFNTSRIPSKIEIELTVLQITSLQKAFSDPRTRLDHSGIVNLLLIHVLTGKIGSIHVTIAGFLCSLRKSGGDCFCGLGEKNLRIFFSS